MSFPLVGFYGWPIKTYKEKLIMIQRTLNYSLLLKFNRLINDCSRLIEDIVLYSSTLCKNETGGKKDVLGQNLTPFEE